MTLRFFSLLIGFLYLLSSYAQKKEDILIPQVPYDSTANYLGDNVAQYTGQELWLKPLPLNQRDLGYSNFVLNYKKSADLNDAKNIGNYIGVYTN